MDFFTDAQVSGFMISLCLLGVTLLLKEMIALIRKSRQKVRKREGNQFDRLEDLESNEKEMEMRVSIIRRDLDKVEQDYKRKYALLEKDLKGVAQDVSNIAAKQSGIEGLVQGLHNGQQFMISLLQGKVPKNEEDGTGSP